jgi:hypothetical protein
MNLGEALRIVKDRPDRTAKNEYQRKYRKRKKAEPGWWENEKQRRNVSRRNGGK